MKLYNTLTRKKDIFKPLRPGRVSLYTCGPTVYNYAHIGNLRTYIFEDVLERALKAAGYRVKRAMNITDVGHLTSDADSGEDKVEKEAKREKKSVWAIAEFYTQMFVRDAAALNIRIPKIFVPATKTIPEQIKIIKILAKKGIAYETARAVYFDVAKFKNYTRLSRQPLHEKIISSRAAVVGDAEKRNPADFALWFKLVDHFANHIMRWPSPWGEGFPGWHIECSAIATKYLGQPFDIHAGGVDHINIHHTNEIAQSEAAFNKPLARYWLHGEFLTINQDRMGKSIGNFITLQALRDQGFQPLHYRYLVLTSHYRSHLEFSLESLRAARAADRNLRANLAALKNYRGRRQKSPAAFPQPLQHFKTKFKQAIADDLNTAQALARIHEFLRALNILMDKKQLPTRSARAAYRALVAADQVLGLNLGVTPEVPPKIKALMKRRELFRNSKQFTQADDLRRRIEALGYNIDDTPSGPVAAKRK